MMLKAYIKNILQSDTIPSETKGKPSSYSCVSLWILTLCAFIWCNLTMSASGVMAWFTIFGTIPILFYACRLFIGVDRSTRIEQFFAALAFAVILALFLKNILDIITYHLQKYI